MKVIFKRTLEETLRIISVLLMIVAGAAAGVILGINTQYNGLPNAFEYYQNTCLIRQHVAVFFLVNGAALMVIVSNIGSGLIANEVHEGTMRILAAKPNSRITILAGKVLGMLTGSILLMGLSLAVMFGCEIAFGYFDGNIANGLLSYLPAYLMYGGMVILVFSSIAVLLSTVMKRKILAVLPMLLLIIMTLGLPIILRVTGMISGEQAFSLPAPVDFNYHFGLMFRWCCDRFGGINGTSNQLDIVAILMNIMHSEVIDGDLTRSMEQITIMKANNALSASVVTAVYMIISLLAYAGSFLIIRKKNV